MTVTRELPVIVPTSDDVKPCEGRAEMFWSMELADHRVARVHCRGSKTHDIPACPFIGWCIAEREAFQASDYRGGLHGTWAGELWVDGRLSAKGRSSKRGRPRKDEEEE